MTSPPVSPVPTSGGNHMDTSNNNQTPASSAMNVITMMTPPDSSNLGESPRRTRSVVEHPTLLAMMRSKSTSDADIPELKNISVLAQTLRSGVDHHRHSHHPRSSHHHPSPILNHQSHPHLDLASVAGSSGDGSAVSPESQQQVPYFPRMAYSEADMAQLSNRMNSSNLPVGELNIDRIEEENTKKHPTAVDSKHHIVATKEAATATTGPKTTIASPAIKPQSGSLSSRYHRYRSGSLSSSTANDYCRVGIVVSDYDTMLSLDKAILSAIANPISKCLLCSFVVLNLQQNQTESFVRQGIKDFIKKNYVVSYQRHQQYYKRSSPVTGSHHDNNHPLKNRKDNLEFHSTELLPTTTSASSEEDIEKTSSAEALPQRRTRRIPETPTMNKEESDEIFKIDESTYIHVLIGNDGFKRLLAGRSGTGESSGVDDCPFVDAIYLMIVDSKKQHQRAMESLLASKHILLHDPVSTSLVDFCQQFQVARSVNRFLQFSTMFVHQYRIKTFLDCVSDSIGFGKIESIDVILNVNYNDTSKVGVTYPPQQLSDNCIYRLGRYCVLITSIMLNRSVFYSNYYYPFNGEQREEEHKPLKAHVLSYTTMSTTPSGLPNDTVNNEDVGKVTHDNHPIDVPVAAKCLIEFTNQRTLTFSVQYSAAPTRQVLTVRANGRYATISDFVIPHPDGLSTCRLYDAKSTIVVPYRHDKGNPPNHPTTKAEDMVDNMPVDVVCGEAVDMPSGPPQDVIMFRRFCELSRAIQVEGWDVKDDFMRNDYNNAMSTTLRPEFYANSRQTTSTDSIGYNVDQSRHNSTDDEFMNPSSASSIVVGGGTDDGASSTTTENVYYVQQMMPSLISLEAQEARDITDVAIQTKCILLALTKSITSEDDKNAQLDAPSSSDQSSNKKRQGVPVPVELPNVW